METEQEQQKTNCDISIIRPEMRTADFKLRREQMTPQRLETIKKGLLTLHTLELMAQNIYKFQLTKEPSEHNRWLITAMCNEMTHLQDFQIKLYEFGFKPSKLRWAYWLVGFALGFGSRLLGKKTMLRVGVWVETKAVQHYAELLETIEWDDDTRKVVEKDQADEIGHINRWKNLLGQLK